MVASRTGNRNNGNPSTKNGSAAAKLDLPAGYRAHSFVRHRDNGGITLSPVDFGNGWSFNMAQIPDFGEFTTLYDAYCLDSVTMKFVLFNNVAEKYPTLLLAPDYDDAAAPTAEADLLTMEGCRVLPFTPSKRDHTITVRPRVAQTLFRTGVTSSYGWGKSGQLVDIATTDTPHYGVRSWVVNYNSTDTAGAVIRVFITYHFRCVGQR
jgi:hypothetical protein